MTSIKKPVSISVEEYLEGEQYSDVRHEYESGKVYAMVGSTSAHNAIAGNLYAALRTHLHGSGCRVFMSDMKVCVNDIFYYPDLVVTCEPWNPKAQFQTQPILLVEVLSDSTKRKDRFEKRTAYQSLDSMKEYVLVTQDESKVEIYRRRNSDWELEIFSESEPVQMQSIELDLPMGRIYEDV